jgi:hypothetical protein
VLVIFLENGTSSGAVTVQERNESRTAMLRHQEMELSIICLTTSGNPAHHQLPYFLLLSNMAGYVKKEE